MKQKKKERVRKLAFFICMTILIGLFPGTDHAWASSANLTSLDGISYLPKSLELYEPTLGNAPPYNYSMKLFSDFSLYDTYVPSNLRMSDGSESYSIPYGNMTSRHLWFKNETTTGASMSITSIARDYGNQMTVDSNIGSRIIEISHLSPRREKLILESFDGFYQKEGRTEDISPYYTPEVLVGFDKNGALDIPEASAYASYGSATAKIAYAAERLKAADRAFVSVSDTRGHKWPYQMKLKGNWAPDENSPTQFPKGDTVEPGTY